ncbi:FxLYD domain-containing protein [Halorussus salinus]|uniref:FxLYD domain-containing protein n=1 Tax=Halorussus salinus TaxID=1364935 RepID=UPI00109222A0|nr:FxLYD domain-containing protein [Halorussus salinus]
MNRRMFLGAAVSTSGVLGLAGCAGTDSESDAADTETPQEEAVQPVESTTVSTPTPAADVSVTSAELASRTTSVRTEAAVTGTIENTGGAILGYVNATAAFYNRDEELLDTAIGDVRLLRPDDVWEPWLVYPGDASDIAEAELRISKAGRLSRTPSPEGVRVRESSMEVPTDASSTIRVTGRVENTSGSSIDYLDVRPQLYAENGHVLASGITSVNNVQPDDIWRFTVRVYLRNPDWKSRIQSHDVTITQ